jgi:hypothetical protein
MGSDGPGGLMSGRDAARGPRPGALTLTLENSGSSVLLRMAGDLDLANIGQVMAALDRVTSNAPLCSSSTFKKSFS